MVQDSFLINITLRATQTRAGHLLSSLEGTCWNFSVRKKMSTAGGKYMQASRMRWVVRYHLKHGKRGGHLA